MLKMLKQSIFRAKVMFGYNGLILFDQKLSLYDLLEVRHPITSRELSVTSESPVCAGNSLPQPVQDVQAGCPGGAINNAAP